MFSPPAAAPGRVGGGGLGVEKAKAEGRLGSSLCEHMSVLKSFKGRLRKSSRCVRGGGIKSWLAKQSCRCCARPRRRLPLPARPPGLAGASEARGDPHCRVPPAGVSLLALELL